MKTTLAASNSGFLKVYGESHLTKRAFSASRLPLNGLPFELLAEIDALIMASDVILH